MSISKILAACGMAAALLGGAGGSAAQAPGMGQDPWYLAGQLMIVGSSSCQQGDQQGCQLMQQMQQSQQALMQSQFACQQGNQQACAFYNQQGQQVLQASQMYSAQLSQLQYGQPQMGYTQGGYVGGNPYDPGQYAHQMRMQAQAQQSLQHSQNMQAQQQANDRAHQRFMETLRGN